MKKSKKVIQLNKLVISKLSRSIMGGIGQTPTCPRPATCGGGSCLNGKCPSNQVSIEGCIPSRDC